MKFLSIISSFLIFSLISCSFSSGNNSSKRMKASLEKWKNMKPTEISIPEDVEGNAVLTRNFYFIIDGSGSMNERTTRNCGGDQNFSSKIQGAKWAIKQFLKQIPDDVNIGMFVFDENGARETVPLGINNREQFLSSINRIVASGETPLYKSIKVGTNKLIKEYQKQLGYGEFRLVVVTDGIADNIPEAAIYAAKYGIPIYTIGLCVGKNHPLRYFSVNYKAADNFAELSQGLKDTLAELPVFDVNDFQESPVK